MRRREGGWGDYTPWDVLTGRETFAEYAERHEALAESMILITERAAIQAAQRRDFRRACIGHNARIGD